MAKSKPDWIKAKAMFEAGKSLRQIAAECFIDNSNISKRAKKDGWQRTAELPQLIADAVSVEKRITALDLPQQTAVTAEIAKQLEGMQFYNTHARIVSKIALKSLQADMTPQNAKTTMSTLKEGLIVEGIVPFYPNAPTINNTNAQQTVVEPVLRPRLSKEEWIEAFGPK